MFNVIAAEDLKTPDGTVRYTKGSVVDILTTNAQGKAESKQLYLGNFELREVKVPEPYILGTETHFVSLVYENQEVAVVTSPITIHNIRQQISIELQKLMERPVDAPDRFNAFKDVTFGLFANEDFKAANGSVVIPKGGLVALITVDDNGKGAVQDNLPFGKYVVQEVKTNAYYRLEDKKYPITATFAGSDKAVAHIQVHNGGIALKRWSTLLGASNVRSPWNRRSCPRRPRLTPIQIIALNIAQARRVLRVLFRWWFAVRKLVFVQ